MFSPEGMVRVVLKSALGRSSLHPSLSVPQNSIKRHYSYVLFLTGGCEADWEAHHGYPVEDVGRGVLVVTQTSRSLL